MSLTKEAIQHLQRDELIKNVNENVEEELAILALPDDIKLHDLEPYLPKRRRYRASLKTASLPDFIDASRDIEPQQGDKQCFIDADAMSATTIFNLGAPGNPGHGDHRATLRLEKTAEYGALLSIDGRQLSQKELAEWLEDWRDCVTGYDGNGETMDIKKVIARVRAINITARAESGHEDQQFGGKRTRLEEISASSRDGEMPAGIIFKCHPYADLRERQITARLSLLTSDTPRLILRIQRPEHLQQQLAEEFRDKLVNDFGDQVRTFLGTISL